MSLRLYTGEWDNVEYVALDAKEEAARGASSLGSSVRRALSNFTINSKKGLTILTSRPF